MSTSLIYVNKDGLFKSYTNNAVFRTCRNNNGAKYKLISRR